MGEGTSNGEFSVGKQSKELGIPAEVVNTHIVYLDESRVAFASCFIPKFCQPLHKQGIRIFMDTFNALHDASTFYIF